MNPTPATPDEGDALDFSPKALERSSEALERSSEAVERSPEAVERSPNALERSPEAVVRSPDVLDLSPEALAAIRATVEGAYPGEGCGILLGRVDVGVRRVARAVSAENRWSGRPDRYRIEPGLLRRLMDEEAGGGLQVLGFFHSHPDCDPVPSETDRERAWPWYLYLIARVDTGRTASLRAWELEGESGFRERELRPAGIGVER